MLACAHAIMNATHSLILARFLAAASELQVLGVLLVYMWPPARCSVPHIACAPPYAVCPLCPPIPDRTQFLAAASELQVLVMLHPINVSPYPALGLPASELQVLGVLPPSSRRRTRSMHRALLP
ncbi:unnamed protein product [Closterium sp. NIES-64]|nr:unnamed protein product [Closterium sp. NIES-64]